MENKRILFIGAGNMATALAVSFKNAGRSPVAVWSRTAESAAQLGCRVGCAHYCDIASLPAADIVIISVVDSAFDTVARAAVAHFPNALFLHTAGSIAMDALRTAGAKKYGVLYPMQTMNKQNIPTFDSVSIFVEGSDEYITLEIENLASLLGGKVIRATSEQRSFLHVAAIFACNFPNALYCMVAELLEQKDLPFDSMLPLIDEAARKVHNMSPLAAQTGPAKRGDTSVMEKHKAMLPDELSTIYDTLSNYIIKRNK